MQEIYKKAIDVIRQYTDKTPEIGLVLGSGLGKLADTLENRVAIAYDKIPGWPQSTVAGHSGQLVIGELEGKIVVAQQGRAHFYEGYDLKQVTFPIRIMYYLGVRTLILTNAAGGLNVNYSAGDVMLLQDHINFVGMAGFSPLRGPNDDEIGPRFPGMVQSYDRELRAIARDVARENNITLREGVYVCLAGPTFETPAEVRMLRILGADAAGMSTAHEVVVARHAGMRVMACSGITNVAIDSPDVEFETNHEEVLETGKVIVPKLEAIIRGVLQKI
ncbi:MAG: purine-nucleoside phosphorylase [Phototrophicales bacterium]|nr:MAG: purine-nucleoside phosphorylase [Phototrophicales bacterium]